MKNNFACPVSKRALRPPPTARWRVGAWRFCSYRRLNVASSASNALRFNQSVPAASGLGSALVGYPASSLPVTALYSLLFPDNSIIARIPLVIPANQHSAPYLITKAERLGHLLMHSTNTATIQSRPEGALS